MPYKGNGIDLTDREKYVIRMRFGFQSKAMSLTQVALRLGVTRQRIHQIEAEALRKLRHHSNVNWLESMAPHRQFISA